MQLFHKPAYADHRFVDPAGDDCLKILTAQIVPFRQVIVGNEEVPLYAAVADGSRKALPALLAKIVQVPPGQARVRFGIEYDMAVVDRADSQRREIRMRRMDNCVGHGNLVVWQDINKVHSVVGPACAQMIERQHLDVDALLFCGWNYVEYEIRIVPNIRRFVSQG